jgi:hypothetical protein
MYSFFCLLVSSENVWALQLKKNIRAIKMEMLSANQILAIRILGGLFIPFIFLYHSHFSYYFVPFLK